jgi:hypothetical protein
MLTAFLRPYLPLSQQRHPSRWDPEVRVGGEGCSSIEVEAGSGAPRRWRSLGMQAVRSTGERRSSVRCLNHVDRGVTVHFRRWLSPELQDAYRSMQDVWICAH